MVSVFPSFIFRLLNQIRGRVQIDVQINLRKCTCYLKEVCYNDIKPLITVSTLKF